MNLPMRDERMNGGPTDGHGHEQAIPNSLIWRSLFDKWPEDIPRHGLVVTTWNETIHFVDYLVSAGVLLIERDKPDTYGARKVLISFDSISAVKITSVIDLSVFQTMHFRAPRGNQPAPAAQRSSEGQRSETPRRRSTDR